MIMNCDRICLLAAMVGLLVFQRADAQVSVKDSSVASPMIAARLGLQLPGRDMATRFGFSSTVGVAYMHKTKSNWYLGFDADFLFGDQVREEGILAPISTGPDANGNSFVIDGNGTYAEIHMYERGFIFMPRFGRLLPLFGPNPNSGLLITLGGGFMQHKIRIEDRDNRTPQLQGDMKKGYDRLTNGFAWQQFIGYMHLGNRHMVNFFAGIEMVEGFTRNRRLVNYDTGLQDLTKRLDMLYGLRAGWIIPFYRRAPEKVYFN